MSKYNDNDGGWCDSVVTEDGTLIHGGAARNYRIAKAGGQKKIIMRACQDAAENALRQANLLASNYTKPTRSTRSTQPNFH